MERIELQILATSDLHGKFMPYDYAINAPSRQGSMCQLSKAIKLCRNPNTILLDAGDTLQDNSAELFIHHPIHPMVLAMNELGYDACTLGNHDFNYGMEVLNEIIPTYHAKVLCGNVFDPDNHPIASSYTIIQKEGLNIGIIGMTTPNIKRWDAENLKDYRIENPIKETKKAIKTIADQVDILIGLFHMGLEREYNEPGSGIKELIEACPEFDVVIASHSHIGLEGMMIGNTLVVENKAHAMSMSKINLIVEKNHNQANIIQKESSLIQLKDYEADQKLVDLLLSYHQEALQDADMVIGKLEGEDLLDEDEIQGIPQAYLEPCPLMNLIHQVQMHYASCQVSSACYSSFGVHFQKGDFKKSDAALVYRYANSLYKLKMNGKQLRKYMEWSVNYYNQYHEGDLTISFNENIRNFNFDLFGGIEYEVDLSQKVGNRISKLSWLDGRPIEDSEEFLLAVCDYRANTQLLVPGEIYEKDELPLLVEKEVAASIGNIRSMIIRYIQENLNGIIIPDHTRNWKLVGINWDQELHKKAIQQMNKGIIQLKGSQDERTGNAHSITIHDLVKEAQYD